MSVSIQIHDQKFNTTKELKIEIHKYLILLEENYDVETAKDLKYSFLEKLLENNNTKTIDEALFKLAK